MEAWIPLTLVAAFVQTLRFMVQKRLVSGALSTGGATFARFVYAAPLAALGLTAYLAFTDSVLPALSTRFWAFAVLGGVSQILATLCVVALFSLRNFAVGITFKKTEVLLTVVVGYILLGDQVTLWGGAAIACGFVAVLILSDPPKRGSDGVWLSNKAVGLGVLSGVFFALSGVGYRGAVLALPGDDTVLRTLVALCLVTALQSVLLGGWLALREPGQIGAVLRGWRQAAPAGVFSVVGSYCWFAAFSLQNAAYVFALGQVELIFSALASLLVFGERITRREWTGMALLTGSVVALVAVT